MTVVELTVIAYNLEVGRSPATVLDEVTALCDTYQPDVFVGCEADYHLQVDGYRTVRRGKGKSRRNVAILVRKPRRIWYAGWVDLTATWTRTKYPELGRHEPRSYRWVRTNGIKVAAVHQPPPFTDNTEPAQSEGIAALVRLIRGSRPAVAIGDFNRRKGERGPGPSVLADAVGGQVVGNRVDCAVIKGLDVIDFHYVDHVGGHPLRSDHKHALVVRLKKKD